VSSVIDRSLVVALGVAAGVFIAGCAEPLTYSQDFKRQGVRDFNDTQFVKAAGDFQAAARQDPADYQTQYYLGLCYQQTGQFHQAVEAYKLCLQLRVQTPAGRADLPTREKCTSRLASLIAASDTAEPEINALQSQADATQSPDDYRLLARIFAIRGDADSAVASYRKATSHADEDASLMKEYGLYLLQINQTTEATRVLKDAYHMQPQDRQVLAALHGLGVTDDQLQLSPVHLQEPPAPAQPAGATDSQSSISAPPN
jgi:Tfp pilus assembly protein PilF